MEDKFSLLLFPLLLLLAALTIATWLCTESVLWTISILVPSYFALNLYFRRLRILRFSAYTRRLHDRLALYREAGAGLDPTSIDCKVTLLEGVYLFQIMYGVKGISLDAAGTQLASLIIPWSEISADPKPQAITLTFNAEPELSLEIPWPNLAERRAWLSSFLEKGAAGVV